MKRSVLAIALAAVALSLAPGCDSPPIEDTLATATQSAPLVERSPDGYTKSSYLTFPWYYFAYDHGAVKSVPLYGGGAFQESRGQIAIDLINQESRVANVTLHFRNPETGATVMDDVTAQVSPTGQVEVLVGKTPDERFNSLPDNDLYFNVFVESSVPLVGFVTWGLSWGAGATFEALENDPAIAAAAAAPRTAIPFQPAYPTLRIDSATYGRNCGAPPGNATAWVKARCDGQEWCARRVEAAGLGDPAPGCSKDLTINYRCGSEVRAFQVPAEAANGRIRLDCTVPYDPGCQQ